MHIDHAALYVNDLTGAKDFFEKYFDASAGEPYHNTATGFRSYFLSFGDGARLEIMTRPEVETGEKSIYRAGYAHIAFSLGSRVKVDELTRTFRSDGFTVMSGPRVTGDGCYESCILGFEDNIIELTI